MLEAAEEAPTKYPEIHKFITRYTRQGAQRMLTHTLLDSGKWEKWNCGAGNNGPRSVLSRAGPIDSSLLAEIERVRGTAAGISTSTLWEHAGKNEYPFLSALEDEGKTRFKTVVAKTLRQAGYVRRSATSTYFFAPGATE